MINIRILHSPGMAIDPDRSEVTGRTDSIETAAGLIQATLMDMDKNDTTDKLDGIDVDVLVVITRR